ncbi:hypothetical protein FB451DRAFT_1260975 [Mycena latifolia]|nr:hypothetical protein FB451DRAFT_1260975 [Mycena latifolia]
MRFIIALLIPFVAVAFANPIVDATARDAALDARQVCPGALQCTNPGEAALCAQLPFQCTAAGLPPVMNDPSCVADCRCLCL